MAEAVTQEQVLETLRVIQDPDLHRDIVTLGFVKDIKICDGNVAFKIELTTPACPVKDQLKAQAQEVVRRLPGVKQVQVEMTALVRGRERAPQELLPGVRHVIAVASGKGGVGKSTVSANLAVALAQTGAKVGLLDADVYGPTLPLMMGIRSKPLLEQTPEGPKIIPIMAYGVKVISMGFFIEEGQAIVWRGPMLGKAVQQLFGDVLWGELDYLVVDLPPGTGDVPMSLAQMVPLSGVVIIMTPQLVAQDIGNKSIAMFRTLEQSTGRPIPILGIVENMSGSVFGTGGAERAAERWQVPFLGRVPLDPNICVGGDAGCPSVLADPDSESSHAFRALAGALAAQVSIQEYRKRQA
ncbi:MAG TPA: Mrp/NBP35 family ATP-binding protein [Chthonomonadaceae bacterium]|nr:Mrp/NBP35 family ATP-binding protein [Chthonomonadaceae bacterium]